MLAKQEAIFVALVVIFGAHLIRQVSAQLPDDIQRELNQNLAEQARIQAMRQQHQKQMQARLGKQRAGGGQQQPTGATHDPNNYSYQQVSPPIQYSYYQPFGDAATTPAPATAQQQPVTPLSIDLNNLNFDLPQPQAQVSEPPAHSQRRSSAGNSNKQQQHFTPSFTGAGGLPVLQPTANSANNADSYVPAGTPPLAPQARVQQGPPLTEADFKDITGGENYGAPGGNDFGLGDAASLPANNNNNQRVSSDNTDAQLREFGLPGGIDLPSAGSPMQRSGRRQQASSSPQINIPDFGSFDPIGAGSNQRPDDGNEGGGNDGSGGGGFGGGDNFGNFDNLGAAGGGGNQNGGQPSASGNNDFDFASQPSSNQAGSGSGGGATDPTSAAGMGGGAPGSLQSLLGSTFPGLGGGTGSSALDDFARGNNDPQSQLSGQPKQRNDDGALDIADLGEKADQFSGADLGGFEQPNPTGDQDFNYGSASNQQPKSVPYSDSNPQAVGSIFAITQPQSLSQARYNALPDKGTYQDYPAYLTGGNDFGAAGEAVDSTPRARAPGPGRYAIPSPSELAPEHRTPNGQPYDYNRAPGLSRSTPSTSNSS